MPLAVDLYCGLGGWTEGLLAEGYDVVGFDIERHEYGEHCYPAQLVLQDVLTLDGSQFAGADLIVASPPCQEYSYMAMPWQLAKQIAAALRGEGEFPDRYRGSRTIGELTALFDACFRIQREASEAAGRHIPVVVENVRGAQPWVGRSRWNFGSFHLWGDVPALMPMTTVVKNPYRKTWYPPDDPRHQPNQRFNRLPAQATKNTSDSDGRKCGGDWFGLGEDRSAMRYHSNKSPKRKAASAMIAKIPGELARHIARTYYPRRPPHDTRRRHPEQAQAGAG